MFGENVFEWFYEHLDWIGYTVFFVSMHLVGQKKKEGWLLAFAACVLLFFLGLSVDKSGIMFWNALFGLQYLSYYFFGNDINNRLRNWTQKMKDDINGPTIT